MKTNFDLGNGRITQATYPAEIVKRGDVEYYRVNIGTDKTMYAYQRVDRSDVTMVGKPKREWPTVPRNAPKVTAQPVAPTQPVAIDNTPLSVGTWNDVVEKHRVAYASYEQRIAQLEAELALERRRHHIWKQVAFNGARQHMALVGKPDIVSKVITPPPANPFRRMQGDVVTAQSSITLPDAVQDRLDAFDEMAKAQGMTALEYMVSVGIDTALDTITNTGKQE